jgi:hypothetical protein
MAVSNTAAWAATHYKYIMKGGSAYNPDLMSILTYHRHIMLWGIRESNFGRGFRILKLIKHGRTETIKEST